MPTISHSTLNSYPGPSGDSYWVSFDFIRKYVGDRLDVYKGRLNGKGCRFGEFALVKIPRHCQGTEEWCDTEISKNRKCHQLSKTFHSFFGLKQNQSFQFSDSWKALMDDRSIMNKRIRKQDWVVIEERLGSDLHNFIDNTGYVAYGECVLLETFVHWSYAVSNGDSVLSNLEGIPQEGSGFKLKTPSIHSVDQRFGTSDLGKAGILKVFENHKCSKFCENWQLPSSRCFEETVVKCRRPSAPQMPYYNMNWQQEDNFLSQNPPSYDECNNLPP